MMEFINKMLELGAQADRAGSDKEIEIYLKEAEDLYLHHIKNIKKPNINKLIFGVKVYDVEARIIQDIVAINYEERKVVMKSNEYGYTSNSFDKVKFVTE